MRLATPITLSAVLLLGTLPLPARAGWQRRGAPGPGPTQHESAPEQPELPSKLQVAVPAFVVLAMLLAYILYRGPSFATAQSTDTTTTTTKKPIVARWLAVG